MSEDLLQNPLVWNESPTEQTPGLPVSHGVQKTLTPQWRWLAIAGGAGVGIVLLFLELHSAGGKSPPRVQAVTPTATAAATVAAPIATPVPIQVIVVAPTPVPTPPCTQIRHDRWRQDDLGVWHQDTWYTCD